MSATQSDFFAALKQAVMFSPAADMKCRQLQTFRVTAKGDGMEFAASNLGATVCDRDKGFFWSRLWHNKKYNPNNIVFEFPVLAIFDRSMTAHNAFAKKSKRCVNYQIGVYDVYTTDCEKGKCQGCTGRTINEIFADTENLLFAALHYASGLREYTLQPGGESGYYVGQYLAALKSAGQISGYEGGADFGGLFQQQNKESVAYRTALYSANIYGTAINVQVCYDNCDATEYNFDLPDFGVLAHEAGCKTCG